jgi:signal transduction histidine kinase
MSRRTTGQLLLAATLLVLLAALGTLQYRWLGQVSDAERDRMRAMLNTRASAFVEEFDRAITRVYVAFQAMPPQIEHGDATAALIDALARANESGPSLVKDVYVFDRTADRPLARLDAGRRALEPIEWPAALDRLRAHLEHAAPAALGKAAVTVSDAIDPATPALIVPVPRLQRLETGGHVAFLPEPLGHGRAIMVVLDAARLQHQLIEPLIAKHFGDPASSDYSVTIARGADERDVVYASSTDAAIDGRDADVSLAMFNLRMNDMQFAVSSGDATKATTMEKFAITIVRRGGVEGVRALIAGMGQGGWRLLVRRRSGTLDALVAASRRRNLAISLGILGLLAGSVALIIGSAQRQQRLARQQMEFVAAVSHELRTPLAVICSAGENLADGVVADHLQVMRYGTLVQTEGRRLAVMVERVMEFAGISSGAIRAAAADVDVARIVADAVNGVSADAHDRGVRIAVHAEGVLPPLQGDADALRSAVQNLVGNAVKYSAPGGTVDVAARADNRSISIRVADQGLGIDASDLPHIFKPFFRGRRAMDAQIRGSGVGLTIVRHVVDAHHGRVHVESRPGDGTAVTMELPLGPAAAAPRAQSSAAS